MKKSNNTAEDNVEYVIDVLSLIPPDLLTPDDNFDTAHHDKTQLNPDVTTEQNVGAGHDATECDYDHTTKNNLDMNYPGADVQNESTYNGQNEKNIIQEIVDKLMNGQSQQKWKKRT